MELFSTPQMERQVKGIPAHLMVFITFSRDLSMKGAFLLLAKYSHLCFTPSLNRNAVISCCGFDWHRV